MAWSCVCHNIFRCRGRSWWCPCVDDGLVAAKAVTLSSVRHVRSLQSAGLWWGPLAADVARSFAQSPLRLRVNEQLHPHRSTRETDGTTIDGRVRGCGVRRTRTAGGVAERGQNRAAKRERYR